ncbi:hypothetical protein CDL12_00598 [Handroanthus impetiginosus]|uniref:Nuclear pore complex protein NUP1-like n=1 Tax=Handroanthus impetiginosus TaxID=429701 RepID=A0A2G9IA39_9LAMI|nr:hypothetical protein CDL12_00598 [Handroanthus impetiginosus]
MATAEEGGATAKTTPTNNSSYGGGGGAGGKFRKKPFRRPSTPYDRPSVALRGNDSSGGWLTRLVVEPASKLISYGAHRLFASVFRKRLPPPPPPHTSELDHGLNDGPPERVPDNQCVAQEPAGGESSQPTNSSSSNWISELEQLLKQKTFTRSEIHHLTELLRSKAGENEETGLDVEKHKKIASSPLEENRNDGDGSLGVMSNPIFNSKVPEDDITSPAELAKAYMGSRPSKLSLSMLGMGGQVSRECTGLLSSRRFASNSPIMSLTTNTPAGLGASENGFITPRYRGRSAIYQMSRPRVHTTSILKRSGINNSSSATMPSTSLSLVDNDLRSESKSMTLKRRSSVLDDEVGSVGPIRRIRQKSNQIAPRASRTADGERIDSDAVLASSKQKFPLIGESKRFSKAVGEYAHNSVRSTNYARVPSKSSEVAARIFQQLEKLTPKEKSSESKLDAVREKSPFRLTPSMLHGPAPRSLENVGSSKLLLDTQDDHKLENGSNASLRDAHDATSQAQGKVEENGPQESVIRSNKMFSAMNNDSAVPLKASWFSTRISNSVVKNGVSEPAQKKSAFTMSAQEDSLELVDDPRSNRLISRPFFEARQPMEAHITESKLSSAQEPKLLRNTIQPEVKSPSDLTSSKTTELRSPGARPSEEGSKCTAFPALEGAATAAAAQSAVLPLSVAGFDKPKESSNPSPLSGFNSKVADKFLSLSSESSDRMPETIPESSGSLVDVAAPTGTLVKADTVPSAVSNGRLVLSPLTGSFTGTSSNDANQISTGGPLCFTLSTGIEDIFPTGTGTSTSATPSGRMFDSAAPPPVLGGPVFKFGASVESSTAVPPVSTMISPLGGDPKIKAEIDPSSGSTSNSLFNAVAFGAASSGSSTFGLSSSSANNLQDSFFTSASKSSLSGVGTVSQGPSIQSVSSAPSPSFNTNISTSFVSPSSNSQVFNPKTTFAFSSSASTSDHAGGAASSSGPTSSVFIFGASSTAISDSNAVSSSSGATPNMFSFGLSSSSSLTNPVGSTGGATSPFSFGGSSPVSASVINTASPFSSGTSGISNFGAISSGPSSAINSVSSNSTPNIFSSSIFGSTLTSASPSAGFSFGALSTSSAPANAAPIVFNSSTGPSSSPIFSFTTSSTSTQPVFGNLASGFAASPGNNNQMNTEDSMAEDPVQSSAPSVPFFSQPAVSPSPPGLTFSSTAPSPTNPFQFGSQQNQFAPQNSSPFQASGSLEFNAGGSFSLGSGGGDKSGRKFVKINRNKNRRK